MKKNEFQWPEFKTETQRIKAYSARFRHMSLGEAFKTVYPKEVISETDGSFNNTPTELKIGDSLPVRIISISKNNVVLDGANQKVPIVTKTNLWKYPKFKDQSNIPNDVLNAVVVDKNKKEVYVDILTPIFHKWLDPLLRTPELQRPTQYEAEPVKVKINELVTGGFIGKAVVPSLTNFVGEPYEVDAFIPGSHIVLNITDDFQQFVGKEVDAFVINYIPKIINGVQKMSLICSVKEYLKYQGDLLMMDIYKHFCDDGDAWKELSARTYTGKVTGGLHSSTKCGIFVEIPSLYTTGMIPTKPEEIVNYKPGQEVQVVITGFETEKRYNGFADQYQTVPAYKLDSDGNIVYSNFKPQLQLK